VIVGPPSFAGCFLSHSGAHAHERPPRARRRADRHNDELRGHEYGRAAPPPRRTLAAPAAPAAPGIPPDLCAAFKSDGRLRQFLSVEMGEEPLDGSRGGYDRGARTRCPKSQSVMLAMREVVTAMLLRLRDCLLPSVRADARAMSSDPTAVHANSSRGRSRSSFGQDASHVLRPGGSARLRCGQPDELPDPGE
jgi:hypothetical protein